MISQGGSDEEVEGAVASRENKSSTRLADQEFLRWTWGACSGYITVCPFQVFTYAAGFHVT